MLRRQVLGALGGVSLLPTVRRALGEPEGERDLGDDGPGPSAIYLGFNSQGDTAPAGGEATIGISIGNDGDDTASNVELYFQADGGKDGNADYFGTEFDVVAHEDGGGEWLHEGWRWSTFPAETRRTPSVTLGIASDLEPGDYVFEIVLTHDGAVEEVENPTVIVEPGGGEPELVLEMTGGTGPPGGLVPLELRLTNTGEGPATGIEGLLIPPGSGWALSGDPEGFSSLAPGESETLSVDITVPEDAEGQYTFEARVRDDAGHEAYDQATVTISPAISGTIVDVHGDPVAETEVSVFAVADRTELATGRTDDDGSFTLEGVDPGRTDETLLLARKEVAEEVGGTTLRRDWFRSRVYGGGPQPLFSLSPSLGEIPLDRQLLFAPSSPTDDFGEPLGVVSMWRFVGNPYQERYSGFSEPTDQVFYAEVTNVNRDGPLGDEDLSDYQINVNEFYDLSSGTFALTVPQDGLVVDYGPQSSADVGGSVTIAGVSTDAGTTAPADWHPRRTKLPVYEAARSLEAAPFAELSTTDAARMDRIEEGFGRLLTNLPIVGSIFSLFDTIDWALGDVLDRHGEITVPVPPDDTNPNRYDDVVLGWQSDNRSLSGDEASVVFAVPLRFANLETAEFVGQAEYHLSDDQPGGPQDGHGFVRWPFEFGPEGHVGGGGE